MNIDNRLSGFGRDATERVSALLAATAVTVLVLAAINAGFTPHAADLATRVLGQPLVAL